MDKSIGKTVKIHIIIHRIRLYKCDSTQHQMTQKRQCFSISDHIAFFIIRFYIFITLQFLSYIPLTIIGLPSLHDILEPRNLELF